MGQVSAIKVDDFEGPLAGWSALKVAEGSPLAVDDSAKLEVTADPKGVHGGKGGLLYAYEVQQKTFRILNLPHEADLSQMKALRFWVKTGVTTPILIAVAEKSGANYNTTALCAADTWQQIHVNMDELSPSGDPIDPNGKLDLAEVTSIQISDLAHMLVNFQQDLQGRRHLWLDDLTFESSPAPLGQGPRVTAGKAGYVADSFENGVVRWSPISIQLEDPPKIAFFDSSAVTDAVAAPEGGKLGLKWTYNRAAFRLTGIMRDVEALPLTPTRGVGIWLKTEKDGTFLLTLEEKDGSRYQTMLQLSAADGWKEHTPSLTMFTLADDSKDENNQVDGAQIKQLGVIDLSALLGLANGENTLRIDEVRFRFAD